MKKCVLILFILLFIPVLAFADGDCSECENPTELAWNVATVGGSQSSGGISYLVDLDMESTVSWSATSGTFTEDCNFDTSGDYCYDTSVYKNGAKSFAIEDYVGWGSMTFAAQTELYADFWYYTPDITGAFFISFFDTSDVEQLLLYSNITMYINNRATDNDTGQAITASTWWHIRVYYKYEVAAGNDGTFSIWASTSDTDFDGDAADYTVNNLDTGASPVTKIRLHGCATGAGKIGRFDDVLVWAAP